MFGQPGSGNEVALTRFAVSGIPGQGSGGGWTNPNIQSQVSRLGNLAARKVGPNALLKVMAGDEVSSMVDYYYQSPVTNGTGNNLLSDVVTQLLGAISGSGVVAGGVKDGATGIQNNLNNLSSPFANAVAPDANNPNGNLPKAYLNVLFFNERFEYVAENSTALRVQGAGNGRSPLQAIQLKAPKNGYCFVYLSNESDEHVYFDNFRVTHNRGRIIEENHYYAYGLKIAAISSSKVGDPREGHLENQHLYNDKELIEDGDLGWYDYGFRNYDPQIGRFVQIDPLTDDYPFLSTYQYAACDPITNIDFMGLSVVPGIPGGSMLGNVMSSLKEMMQPVMVSAKAVKKSVGFWGGVGRFAKGAWNGFKSTASFAINTLNPDPSKNSIVQTGKFLIQTATDPVGTFNAVKEGIKNTDWSDPYTYGNMLGNLVTPGAVVKTVSNLSKVSKLGTRLKVFKGSPKKPTNVVDDALEEGNVFGAISSSSSGAVMKLPKFADAGAAFEHYAKHAKGVVLKKKGKATAKDGGPDVPEFGSLDDYINAAQQFFMETGEHVLLKMRPNGEMLRFNTKTGYFGVQKGDGTIKTFFRPDDGVSYFLNQ